jgi:hypothetical protein
MKAIKGASILVCSFVVLLGTSHFGKPAQAGSGAAFLGGMVTSHVIGGFVRRDQARTSAAVHQAYSQPTYVQAAPAPAAPAEPAQKTIEQRLDALDDLANRGIITKDEYSARRQAILDSL